MLRRLFERKQSDPPATTDLSLRLLQGDWKCSCCGKWFNGIMDLAVDKPDPWPHGAEYEPNAALRMDGDFLSEDFCVLDGEHYMVRGVLEFPIQGLDQKWGFGCWTSLSKENFDKYVEAFDVGLLDDQGPWFGWLCNGLKGLYTDDPPIPLDVYPQAGRQRPRLIALDEDNPIARVQREGLSGDDLLAILRANGHGPTVQ
ncbi:MAG: DUF2199 domain-containing protein [Sphingorhabdus sp.]